MKKERLITIAIHDTYEVPFVCDEETAKAIEQYPKTRKDLGIDILNRIEKAGDYGECVDTYAEIVEIDTVDFWGDGK